MTRSAALSAPPKDVHDDEKAEYDDQYWPEPIPGGPPIGTLQEGDYACKDDEDAEDKPPYRYSTSHPKAQVIFPSPARHPISGSTQGCSAVRTYQSIILVLGSTLRTKNHIIH